MEQKDRMAEPGHSRVCGQVGRCAGPGQVAWAPSLALPPPSRVSVGRHVSPFGLPSPLSWRGGPCALELSPVADAAGALGGGRGPPVSRAGEQTLPCRCFLRGALPGAAPARSRLAPSLIKRMHLSILSDLSLKSNVP